jgi:hypothetical protein
MQEHLFETVITSKKQTKTNYEDQFKINQILNDEIERRKKQKRIQLKDKKTKDGTS